MNLLEVVAEMSSRAHEAKEQVTATEPSHDGCTCDRGDYCRAELPAAVVAYRGGQQVVSMTLRDHQLRYPVDIAARLYHADTVAVVMDGRSKETEKCMVIVTAVNRAGDELWRVEPYSIAPDGRSVIWWPAEVPDEHPILESWCADQLVKTMNKRIIGPPSGFDQITPGLTFEQRRTVMDIGVTRQIVKHADAPWHNIFAISLAAKPGTARSRLLAEAGDPEMWL